MDVSPLPVRPEAETLSHSTFSHARTARPALRANGRHNLQSRAIDLAIVCIGIVLSIGVWHIVMTQIQRERHETIEHAIQLNTNVAVAFEEYTIRAIRNVDFLTQQMIQEYGRKGKKTDIRHVINQIGIENGNVASAAILDENGQLVISAFSPSTRVPLNFSDVDHFKVHVSQDLERVVIGRPILSRIFGKLAVPITRRINKPDGSFGGVVIVQIEPSYFTKFYRDATLQQPDVIALVGLDGTVRAQRQGKNETAGQDISWDPVFTGLAARSAGETSEMDRQSGEPRYLSYRTLEQFPLLIMVSSAEPNILKNFNQRKSGYLWGATLVTILIALLAMLSIVARRRQQHIIDSLQESESRFRTLLESLPQLVWICDREGKAKYCNRQLVEFSGLSYEDTLGTGWQRLLHRDDRERVWQAWQESVRNGNTFAIEYRLRRADGNFRWMLVRGEPLHHSGDTAARWLGTCTDIEEQKRTEKNLHESERFARATIDALSKHIAVIDASGKILTVNKAWRSFAMENGDPDQTTCEGANYLAVCRSAAANRDTDAQAVLQMLEDIIAGKLKGGAMEYPCHSPTSRRWFLMKIDRFDDEEPLRFVVAHENITEKKLAEERIYFQAHLLDSVGQAVIATDMRGHITYWNKYAEKLYGWPFDEVTGKNFLDVIQIDLPGTWRNDITNAVNFGNARSGEFSVQDRNGRRFPAQVSNTPIYDESGTIAGIVGIYSDITQRKNFERRLREEERRFKAISTNIPGMVFQLLKDAERLSFTFASEGTLEVCGHPPEDMMADFKTFVALLDDDSASSFFLSMGASAEHLRVWNWEGKIRTVKPALTKWINLRATPRATANDAVVWDGVIFNITEAKEHEASLREQSRLLQDLSAHEVSVKEDERKRISREIHDELGQRLTVMRMDIMMLKKRPDIRSMEAIATIERMRTGIDDVLKIIRDIASALRPAALDIGFVTAVEWLIDDFQSRLRIPCTFTNQTHEPISMSEDCATGVFRILQESLTNIARHANARSIRITLAIRHNRLALEISDDGVGFEEKAIAGHRSFGLVGMRERAMMLNGEIKIESKPNAGTTVKISIPLDG